MVPMQRARKNTFWQFATGAKPVLFSGSHGKPGSTTFE